MIPLWQSVDYLGDCILGADTLNVACKIACVLTLLCSASTNVRYESVRRPRRKEHSLILSTPSPRMSLSRVSLALICCL